MMYCIEIKTLRYRAPGQCGHEKYRALLHALYHNCTALIGLKIVWLIERNRLLVMNSSQGTRYV
jgi:hypothetical protein